MLKPPKLKIRPGTYLTYAKQLYVVRWVYRLSDDPHEWHFCLEERKEPNELPHSEMDEILLQLCASKKIPPLIMYEPLWNERIMKTVFVDIPAIGNRVFLSNTKLRKDMSTA